MADAAKAVERHDVAEIVARRPTASPYRRFNIVLIKTSHYDDDGYVVMVADCAVRIVLDRDVTINLTAIDETNKRLNCEKLTAERRVQLRNVRRAGNVAYVHRGRRVI